MTMAQKRTKGKDFSHVKTFNLFSAFSKDGKMKSTCDPALQQMESDEEEDLEELKAKLQKTSSSKGGKVKEKKKGRSKYMDSDEDDEEVEMVSRRSSGRNGSSSRALDSPSPPPSPEFDERTVAEIIDKNRAAAQVIQNLESTVRTYQMSKARNEILDSISPVKDSPTTVYNVDDPVARDTITVKVRSRNGMLRFENYQMNATFDEIFAELGSMEGVDQSQIRVTRKGDDISETDTPKSIKLHIADILDYVVVEGTVPAILSYSLLDEEDFIIVRLRTSERNSETSRKVAKMDTLLKVFEEFATANGKPLEKMKFLFDGESISGQNTPLELDMDEENVVDVEVLP